MKTVRLLRPAEQEMLDAVAYYDLQVPGLGDAFLDKVASAAALTWALAQAYALTRIPLVGKRVTELQPGLIRRAAMPKPFDLWATKDMERLGLSTNKASELYQTMLPSFRTAPSNLLSQACAAQAIWQLHTGWQWEQFDSQVDRLERLNPGGWRSADYPMLTLVAIMDALSHARQAQHERWALPFARQLVATSDASGFWSPQTLGVNRSVELSTFSNDRDGTLYATCMAVMAIQPLYLASREFGMEPVIVP